MPIKPENKKYYGSCWKWIRLLVMERAKNACEWCGAGNYLPNPRTGSKVILTIAHLNHRPSDNNPGNLAALCQQCHNAHDAKERAKNRKINAEKIDRGGVRKGVKRGAYNRR